MSWKPHFHDWWKKVLVSVGSSAVIGAAWWLHANIVFAGDLEPIAEAVKAVAEQSKENQDEWRCSELDEELADFYAKQEAGETLSARELDRMARIKERMGTEHLNCVRFED